MSVIQILLTGLLLCVLTAPSLAKPSAEFPPAVKELTIVANGSRMPGLAYLAAGEGPHPGVLLLHGYPGNEKNLDVAQALRRMGWSVVFFHYRGAWGAEGEFSYRGAEQDVQTVLQYMRNPDNAKALRINPQRISTVGHSMGGHMAMAGMLDNPAVRCAVSYDGANMGARGNGLFSDPEAAEMWKAYSDSLFMLAGWSGAKAIAEIKQYGQQLDLVRRAKNVGQRSVLMVGADSRVIPMDVHITPVLEALRASKESNIRYLLIDDDHSFSASRLQLIGATADFLAAYCR